MNIIVEMSFEEFKGIEDNEFSVLFFFDSNNEAEEFIKFCLEHSNYKYYRISQNYNFKDKDDE